MGEELDAADVRESESENENENENARADMETMPLVVAVEWDDGLDIRSIRD